MSSPLTFSSTLLTALADVDDANHSSSDNEDESEAEEEDDEDEDAFHIVAQHLAYGPGHPQWSGDLMDFACTRRWRSLGDRLVSVPWPILYVEATYQAPEGSTALHHACSSSTCPAVVLTMLVELCGKAEVVQELEDEEGMSPFEMIGGEGENTPLHYFAFRSDNLECLWPLILKAPQCLVHVNRYGRIPSQTATAEFAVTNRSNHAAIANTLARATFKFRSWPLQLCVHMCVRRMIFSEEVEEFTGEDRQRVGVEDEKAWFALGVIGWFLQREAAPVTKQIIEYVGVAPLN